MQKKVDDIHVTVESINGTVTVVRSLAVSCSNRYNIPNPAVLQEVPE